MHHAKYPDRALHEVTGDSLEKALQFCKTVGTFNRYRAMLMAILNAARNKGWITELPKLAPRRDKKTKPRDWLTEDQWTKLYAELPAHMKPMAAFAIETGLRQVNVLGLRWSNLSIERRALWLEARDMKSDVAFSVPLSDRAIEVLHEQQGQHPEFVFTYRGRPIQEVKTAFQAACVRAGVPTFTWHGFRHTWATWHVQNGTPLDVLQKLGGWADLRMVMNYAHHSPGYLAGFANNTRKR
jgi:integrase